MTRRAQCFTAALLAGTLGAGNAGAEPYAVLGLDLTAQARRLRPVDVPELFTYHDTTVTALAFSLDIDVNRLLFNPADQRSCGVEWKRGAPPWVHRPNPDPKGVAPNSPGSARSAPPWVGETTNRKP